DVPLDGYARALERFAGPAPAHAPAALGRLRREPAGLRARVRAWLTAGIRRPRAGDLVHASHLEPGARPKVVRLPATLAREGGA
ncbi:MAG: hypothetical protein ACFE0R_06935, partial [Salinarimonas sp.]